MNTLDKKEIDQNGFWYLYDNPITKVGVFQYLGRQISPDLEPDKIYQVLRPQEELTKPETLESFKLKPLINEHEMLGSDNGFTPPEKKGIHGTLGENVKFDKSKGLITNNLIVYSDTLKKAIEDGKKELSLGYKCRYELTSGEYQGTHYDAIQRDIYLNHIALVDEGRMGHEVRVQDCAFAIDSYSEILEIQKKEQSMEQEKTATDVDKREILREADAIAMKPASEFEGGEEEKFRTLTKKLEELSYEPSESNANDEDVNIEINQGEEEQQIGRAHV